MVKPVKPWIPTDSPVYELSVADFTADPNSQVPAEMRSKYAGMTAKTPGLTGLNYLKWLGIGAVQIMPIEMWNPAHRNDYNWGYETYLFNVPESQYSGHPEQPLSAVKEVKSMVSKFHQSGISVVMDVVYNHSVPSEGVGSPFWQTQPYFFFRTDDAGHVLNESGVGNALDDDRPYVRRYIRDSLIFWAKNYGVDGFRFDLMGMFARTSLLDWRKALDRLRPGIVMYGEPWTGGGPLRFGKGDQKGTHIAVFNDNFRNAIRGDLDGTAPGYAMGNRALAPAVAIGLKGSTSDFTATPSESINYVSVHDNRTLWDKIAATLPGVTADARKKVLEKCGELILTAQGIPFLEGGAELGRTKGGNNNSYNAGVAVNQFDWKRAATFQSVANRYRDLIKERKEHAEIFSDPATRSQTKILPNGQIRLTYQFGKSTISFTE
jgi:pullulanase